MTLFDQEKIFKYFNDTYEACINVAKSKGQYDSGIMSILAYSIKQKAQKVIHTDEVSGMPLTAQFKKLLLALRSYVVLS